MIDLGHIEKLINMANALKVQEQATVQQPQPERNQTTVQGGPESVRGDNLAAQPMGMQ
jgi:hypothetical protein